MFSKTLVLRARFSVHRHKSVQFPELSCAQKSHQNPDRVQKDLKTLGPFKFKYNSSKFQLTTYIIYIIEAKSNLQFSLSISQSLEK